MDYQVPAIEKRESVLALMSRDSQTSPGSVGSGGSPSSGPED